MKKMECKIKGKKGREKLNMDCSESFYAKKGEKLIFTLSDYTPFSGLIQKCEVRC
jgi:hypothetical protein